jgi:putative NIF3 family GTP cyclohydrolase 1 type 2
LSIDPIIFRGLKSITLEDTQQRSLLRLAQHGISVYSPHTAVDTVPGGMADWLCDVVTGVYGDIKSEQSPIKQCASSGYSAPTYPRPEFATSATRSSIPHTRSTIHPSPAASIPEGFESAGAGRLVTFNDAQPLSKLIDFIGQGVGLPGGIPIAIPQSRSVDDIQIRTVGMCPGSGSGVLLRGEEIPDLLFTGEMSHHEALAATERGSVVISLAHSNSERGYLHAVMRNKLLQDLSQRWHGEREVALKTIQESVKQGGGAPAESSEVFRDAEVSVSVSEADRDPYGIMIRR